MNHQDNCHHHSSFNFGLLLGLILGGAVGYFLNQQSSSRPTPSAPSLSKVDPNALKEKLSHLRQTLARLDATLSQKS